MNVITEFRRIARVSQGAPEKVLADLQCDPSLIWVWHRHVLLRNSSLSMIAASGIYVRVP